MHTQDKRGKIIFLLFQSVYDCAVTKMDILALSVSGNGAFSLSTSQYQEMVRSQFSATQWTKQPCDCLTAEVKKQEIQQKHATTAMETTLRGGSPALF